MHGYQDLKVWQLGMEMSVAIYRLTSTFPKHETYGLASQLQRAAVSVPSNIAEGHSRGATKDLIRFVNIAKGSLAELETQLLISRSLQYGSKDEINNLLSLAEQESKMLSGYRRSLKSKLSD